MSFYFFRPKVSLFPIIFRTFEADNNIEEQSKRHNDMNISRFTPPVLWSKGLQIVKNEASKKPQSKSYACSIALAILFLISNFFILGSCSSDDDNQKEENAAHYYVKYEVSFPGLGRRYTPNTGISYTSEKGQAGTTTQTWGWEGTFGPFKAGTTVSVSASCDKIDGYNTTSRARISVCNGNSPFILKAETTSRAARNISVTYTIKETD